MLDEHPHAAAVLGAALADDGRPAHAYLLHGPAGTGKREAARRFAGALLAQGAPDPDGARARVEHGAHPDLTWIAPSGAHEMLRRDVDESVVSAASRTPFEAHHRVFVLERADTMNDEAANALLKTLEEPPPYVVLLLLTDRIDQVLPTISSRCQGVRFDPPPAGGARAAAAEPGRPAGDRDRLRAALARRRRQGARARPRRRPGAARAGRGVRARPLAAARRALAPAARPRPRRAAPRPASRSMRRSPTSSPTCPRRSTASARPSSTPAPSASSAAPRPARSTTRSSSSGSGTATSAASSPVRPSSCTTPTASRS